MTPEQVFLIGIQSALKQFAEDPEAFASVFQSAIRSRQTGEPFSVQREGESIADYAARLAEQPASTSEVDAAANPPPVEPSRIDTGNDSRDSHARCDVCDAPSAAPCYDWCDLAKRLVHSQAQVGALAGAAAASLDVTPEETEAWESRPATCPACGGSDGPHLVCMYKFQKEKNAADELAAGAQIGEPGLRFGEIHMDFSEQETPPLLDAMCASLDYLNAMRSTDIREQAISYLTLAIGWARLALGEKHED